MFFREFRIQDGETVTSVWTANLYQGARSVGGRLRLTNRALLFEPNWLDHLFTARGKRFSLTDFLGAEVEPAQLSLSPHKARTRVRLWTTADSALVAVRDPHEFVDALNSAHHES